ncbi:unnamed protein product [Schistosoma mattheei]|uniref:Uncharacterized protein n=1 Tax=Schistosoma mattheei TaxID=31246 RepID=A0AA85BAT2_9TREM|nr:unnamed protein product [Schistosoma mattheei]
MTIELNQTVEYTNEFLNFLPYKSTCSEVCSNTCKNMPKENELKTKKLVPVQRTYNECILYALSEWRCACLTTVLVTGIILVSSCGVKQLKNYMNSSQSDTHYPISYHKYDQSFQLLCQTSSLLIINGLLFLVYLIYLIESWQSRNWIQTTWLIDTKMAYNLIHNAHKLIPSILWQIKCYHYAHNTPQYYNHYQQNPMQQSITLNETDLNKPIKYSFIQDHFNNSMKQTNTQNNQYLLNSNKIPKLLSHSINNTNINPINTKQEFFTTYEKFDVYMETEQICTFTDFMKLPKKCLIIHQSSKLPFYLKDLTYLIATLLLCSLPLRIYIYANKAKLNCKIHKIFGSKPINHSLKLIPLNTNSLINTFPNYTIPSSSLSSLSNHILNGTNHHNKLHDNNEAIVLFNKHILDNTTDLIQNYNKKHKMISKDSYDFNHIKYDNKVNIKHSSIEDEDHDDDVEDEDEEMLSLDIRFDEYIKNKCIKNDKRNIENHHNHYELNTILKNSNVDVKSV